MHADNKFRQYVLVCAFIPLLILFSCATDRHAKEMAHIHLKTGIASLESGHYTAALKELFEAKRLNPQDPTIYYYLGISYHGKGFKRKAAAEFQRACSLKPDYSEAHNYLGLIYFEEGKYKESVSSFRKALANILYETPEFALNNLGKAYMKMGNRDKALARFEEALKIRPNKILPIIHMNTGALLISMNRPDEAVRHLKKSVEIAPYITESRYWLGKGYLLKGNRTQAVKELKTAYKLGPQSEFGLKSKNLLLSINR